MYALERNRNKSVAEKSSVAFSSRKMTHACTRGTAWHLAIVSPTWADLCLSSTGLFHFLLRKLLRCRIIWRQKTFSWASLRCVRYLNCLRYGVKSPRVCDCSSVRQTVWWRIDDRLPWWWCISEQEGAFDRFKKTCQALWVSLGYRISWWIIAKV